MNPFEAGDAAILIELGQRLSRRRIDRNLTQAGLAKEAGISKRTLERMEAGGATQTTNLVRVLRVLDLLAGLHQLVPEAGPSPLALLKAKGKERQRASSPRRASRVAEPPATEWTWGDES